MPTEYGFNMAIMDKQQYIKYIANESHYNDVLIALSNVKHHLWIGTADIKDLYMKDGSSAVPFLSIIAKMINRGVEVRMIHAKEPGPAFREDFDRYPILAQSLERVLCPRVHFKMIIMDFETAYIGSANLTGAGIGMKGCTRCNFEADILTNEPSLVESASEQFDTVWRGAHCAKCGRKQYCKDQIKK